jgi:hypothetical protein
MLRMMARMKRYECRIDHALDVALTNRARAENRSKSAVVRDILRETLRARTSESGPLQHDQARK